MKGFHKFCKSWAKYKDCYIDWFKALHCEHSNGPILISNGDINMLIKGGSGVAGLVVCAVTGIMAF